MGALILFQIILGLFILLILAGVTQRYRAGLLSARSALLWGLIWIGAGVALIFPEATTIAANHLGIGRGTDFVFYLGFALVFFLLFRMQLKIEQLSREITTAVRQEALKGSKK